LSEEVHSSTATQISMPLAEGLFTCQHCGALITGKRINCMLGDAILVVEKRKPFDELAKRLSVTSSRDGAHRFEQMETLATTCVRAYPADRPPQLRFLARLANGDFEE
jgi:hypothetical protein